MKKNGKAGAFCITAMTVLCMSCNSTGKDVTVVREVPVKTWIVAFSENAGVHDYMGTVEGESSTSLSFQVPGYVERIYVREGQQVEKGELLARLDKTTLQSTYDAAYSTLRQAEDAYTRMEQLYQKGSLPEIKWVEVQSSLQQARSMEQIARKNLDDVELRAPYAGVVAQKKIDTGSSVLPGVPVFQLMKVARVNVNMAVPEDEIPTFALGQEVKVTVAALGDRTFSGKVIEKGVTADPLVHTYKVLVQVDNRSGELLPGMVCVAHVESASDSAIVIPNRVVQIDSGGSYFVWLDCNGRATKRSISVAYLSGDGVVVESGLSIGDKVIVEGASKVSENMKVTER